MEEVLSTIKEEFRIVMALSGKYLYFKLRLRKWVVSIYLHIVTPNLKTTIVTESVKRGLIAFLKFQLQLVSTRSVFSLLLLNCSQEQNHVKSVR